MPDKHKSDGSVRNIFKPHPLIRKIQRRMVTRILSRPSAFCWPDHLFGSIPNVVQGDVVTSKDYIACASRHCGAKSLLKLDIKNFFENVHEGSVLEVFRQILKYDDLVARVLTRIVMHDGGLPQGGITSSYLAALSLHDVESRVVERLRLKRLVYTRYVDDITISSKATSQDFDFALKIVEQMLLAKDLPLNLSKVEVQRISTTPLTVHGLRVAFSTPRLPADEVGKIRAGVRYMEKLYSEGTYRFTPSYRRNFNKCMGRVNKLARVGHQQHPNLVARMSHIYPKAGRSDLKWAYKIAQRLKKQHPTQHATFGFYKRFHVFRERLNLIGRDFPGFADKMRRETAALKPTFE